MPHPPSTSVRYIVLAVQIDERVSSAMAHDLALRSVDRCIEDVNREFHCDLESMTVLDDLNFASDGVESRHAEMGQDSTCTPLTYCRTKAAIEGGNCLAGVAPGPLAELSHNESEVMPSDARSIPNGTSIIPVGHDGTSVATPLGEDNSNPAAKISKRGPATQRVCQHCGSGFLALNRVIRFGGGKFCSKICSAKASGRKMRGTKWHPDRRIRKQASPGDPERHGLTNTPEYGIWCGIKTRTLNPKCRSYPQYGGRGIGICDSWKNSFATFLKDMGPRPSPNHSVDRIDGSRGYSPDNCRWATPVEQASNRRGNVMLTFNGKTQTLSRWARELGFNKDSLFDRIDRGWSVDRALSTPMRPRNNCPSPPTPRRTNERVGCDTAPGVEAHTSRQLLEDAA